MTEKREPSAEQRAIWAEFREGQRREACVRYGVDPDTLLDLPRPPPELLKAAAKLAAEQLDDREVLSIPNRIALAAAMAAISSAQDHDRSAAALEAIAERLVREQRTGETYVPAAGE